MNITCDLITCRSRLVNKLFQCIVCDSKFCSEECKINHSHESHKPNSIKRKSIVKSPFMKSGQYLKDIVDDPKYYFKNFEFLINNNNYLIIGSGSFGDVLLARNKDDQKVYAIKQMKKDKIIENGAPIEIVSREIQIHRRLIHENIVRMYSYYEDKENYYLIMEYVSGGTLFHLIKRSKGMDEKTAFKYFISAAAAVNFLHENKLVHRDLKPENLLLDENGVVKLCDFGWCVELDAGVRSTFCGTYEYMAPEIINEAPYNNTIDAWSLGVLLYELLHGYSPFRAKNNPYDEDDYKEIFRNIVKYNFEIEKTLTDSCVDLIKRLVSPDSKNRIKIKDIFYHPWVRSFETEYKEQKMSTYREKIQNTGINKTYENKENISTKQNSTNDNISLKKNSETDKKINFLKNDNNLKGKDTNDVSFLERNSPLFDKVLNQVKQKNKTKKKTKDKQSNIIIDFNGNKDSTKVNRKRNFSMLEDLSILENKIENLANNNIRNEKTVFSSKDDRLFSKDRNDFPKEEHKLNNFNTENNKHDISVNFSDREYNLLDRDNNNHKSELENKKITHPKKYDNTNLIQSSLDDQAINKNKKKEKEKAHHKKDINSFNISRTVDIHIIDEKNNQSRQRHTLNDANENHPKYSFGQLDKEIDRLNQTLDQSNSKLSEKKALKTAIEILEKAQEIDSQVIQRTQNKDKSFWSFMNTFRCGHNN